MAFLQRLHRAGSEAWIVDPPEIKEAPEIKPLRVSGINGASLSETLRPARTGEDHGSFYAGFVHGFHDLPSLICGVKSMIMSVDDRVSGPGNLCDRDFIDGSGPPVFEQQLVGQIDILAWEVGIRFLRLRLWVSKPYPRSKCSG
ncbi:MAG: hypothetical protein WAM85_02860 [Terracidiphilus sp.]